MSTKGRLPDSRERLILAGIADIEQYGVTSLSLRRVAKACGVSCAAPYKHFLNKPDFLVAIMDYINARWYTMQAAILQQYPQDSLRTLYELAIAYVRFLVENPHFRSIIMMRTTGLDERYLQTRANLSAETKRLISECCQTLGVPPETELQKTFIIRSIIYGASLMLDNGQIEANEGSYRLVQDSIAAVFGIA